jgi:SNF2 family DNA or RNA helicase
MKKDWLYAFDMLPGDTPILSKKAENAMIALLRCEQLAQGFVGGLHRELAAKLGKRLDDAERIDGREEELFFPKHPKVQWLIETIESLLLNGKSPVVWFKYNAPLRWFASALPSLVKGAKPITLHGSLSSKDKALAVSAFQEGVGNVFLGQVKMAEGFNLTRSQDAIFFGRDWSPAINSQAEDRIHRIGQTGTCNIYLPVVNDTIEAHIHARLREKKDTAESVMGTLTVAELKEML